MQKILKDVTEEEVNRNLADGWKVVNLAVCTDPIRRTSGGMIGVSLMTVASMNPDRLCVGNFQKMILRIRIVME